MAHKSQFERSIIYIALNSVLLSWFEWGFFFLWYHIVERISGFSFFFFKFYVNWLKTNRMNKLDGSNWKLPECCKQILFDIYCWLLKLLDSNTFYKAVNPLFSIKSHPLKTLVQNHLRPSTFMYEYLTNLFRLFIKWIWHLVSIFVPFIQQWPFNGTVCWKSRKIVQNRTYSSWVRYKSRRLFVKAFSSMTILFMVHHFTITVIILFSLIIFIITIVIASYSMEWNFYFSLVLFSRHFSTAFVLFCLIYLAYFCILVSICFSITLFDLKFYRMQVGEWSSERSIFLCPCLSNSLSLFVCV